MSNAWDGTCGFHNAPEDDHWQAIQFKHFDQWPVGDVAFRTTSADLVASAKALYVEAEHAPERADVLVAVAEWYKDLALDLAEIQALPETVGLMQGGRIIDPSCEDDIPF